MSTSRIHYIDVSKGIAIVLVILGHCSAYSIGDHSRLFYTIYAFHIPFWFFISGLLYHTRDWQSYFSRKVKSLVLPYILFCLCNTCFYFVASIIGHISLYRLICFGGLWFILTLFYVTILYYLADTICLKGCNTTSKSIIVSLFAILALFVGIGDSSIINESYTLSVSLVAFFFFRLGVFSQRAVEWLSSTNRIVLLSISLLLLSILALTAPMNPSPIDVRIGRFGNRFLFVSQAVMGIAGMSLLSIAISANRHLEYLGRNSLLIFALHFPVWRLSNHFFSGWGLKGYYLLGCVFACTVIVTLLILIPINKYFPWFKGEYCFLESNNN